MELRAPPSVLCVSHHADPQKRGSYSPLHAQGVANSLGGTDLSIVDTDPSKVSVPTIPLGLQSLLSCLQLPKPWVPGPVLGLGYRDATYKVRVPSQYLGLAGKEVLASSMPG